MGRYIVHGRPGWGSVLTEAQLDWYGLPYDFVDDGDLFEDEEARLKLAKINPLPQYPTLVLPDGQVMTESAAITLHLADAAASDELVPAAGDPGRPRFLRWLVFLVANIYPTFTYADVPGRFVPGEKAAEGFRANIDEYQKTLWSMVEAETQAPWFLGKRFSALDIYFCAMTRWRPRQPWFEAHAPKVFAAGRKCDDLPKLKAVWLRNYPPE